MSEKCWRRVFVIVASSVFLGACSGEPAEPWTPELSGVPSDAVEYQEDRDLLVHTWWNEAAVIKKLELDPVQREKLNVLFRLALAKGRFSSESPEGNNFKAFVDALEKGDTVSAARFADAVADRMARKTRLNAQLKIEASRVLTPEQRSSLSTLYPELWRSSWQQQAMARQRRNVASLRREAQRERREAERDTRREERDSSSAAQVK
ncbi:MAG: Spy/CpxP family protein refolding chaperone [Myxococcota bacterium]